MKKILGKIIFIPVAILVLSIVIFKNYISSDLPTSKTATIQGENITVVLNFKGEINRTDGSKDPWTEEKMKPFIENMKGWTKVIKGIKGKDNHTLTIDVKVDKIDNALGVATPDLDTLLRIGERYFPTKGKIVINNELYDIPEAFKPASNDPNVMSEFDATIYHEYGHIFGIGALWYFYDEKNDADLDLFTLENTTNVGKVIYNFPKAIAAYNEIFNTNLDFLPISDDSGHLYDAKMSEDKKRTKGIWKNVKSMSYELMANGYTLTKITASILDDMGWNIDYSTVKKYDINYKFPDKNELKQKQ